ncbi:MAG: toprim domain-containing protein, partial [Ruminococcus sp.]
MRLSEEQIERASTVNLPQFLMQNGFDLKRVGREYVWKDHDSMHIKDNAPGERGVWHRFSTDEGGDNIAFLRQYMNMSFVEAVEALNGEHYDPTYTQPQHTHTERQQKVQAQELVFSEAENAKRVFAYLCKTRGLDYELVKSLVQSGAVAQEQKTGNVLFKFTDEHGKTVGAEKVGTSTEHKFKGVATGSAGGYGFEVCRGNGSNLLFFESSIDMLSYLQMHQSELNDYRLVSMMGVKPQTVIDTMERYGISPDKVYLCSDNDRAGNEFAERLISEYPEMKRIVTPNTYKDWNDMLRGIPKKEIDTEQKTEVKKEADRMAAIGNEYWNSATDNRDKAVISMSVEDFRALFQKLEDSGLNYRAYRVASGFKMAVNAADVGTIRQLAGKNLEAAGSTVPFSPPEKNIIGNVEYRYIPNKEYISADRDLILKMAEMLDKQGIKFSGRIYPTGKGTLTVSRDDLAYVRSVRDNIIGKRRQVGIGEKGQIIGNRSVSAQNRHLYMSTLTPKQYEEVKPFIETNARYSGVIRDGKVMFSVDRDEAQAFHRALDTAKREVGLIHTMQEQGLQMEQMIALSPVMHRLAVEDAQLQLSDFFDKRYDEAQFGEMLSLVNAYLDQPASERYGEHSKLNDMLEAKSSFDRTIELSDFFSQHDFSEEQKSAIATMFVGEVTRGQIDSIDETFTAEDIQEYAEILQSALQESDIANFLTAHKQTVIGRENAERVPTEEEVLFSQADLARFLAEHTLSSDEWESMAYPLFERGYLEKHQPSEKSSFGYHLPEKELYALAERYHQGDDIRRELALGLMIHSSDNIADKDRIEFVFEDGKITDRTYYYAENLRHSLHLERTDDGYNCSFGGMERFVSLEEIGQAFLDRTHEEFEDLAFWWVRDDMLDAVPDISDEKIADLLTAFDGAALHGWETGDNQPKINRIKKALHDILGDEVQTEKAFAIIAKKKYNVTFEPERKPDSLEFQFGYSKDGNDRWFTESGLLSDFAEEHGEISFALANALMEYLDDKQHKERMIPDLNAGYYKKTNFEIRAVVDGQEFNFSNR